MGPCNAAVFLGAIASVAVGIAGAFSVFKIWTDPDGFFVRAYVNAGAKIDRESWRYNVTPLFTLVGSAAIVGFAVHVLQQQSSCRVRLDDFIGSLQLATPNGWILFKLGTWYAVFAFSSMTRGTFKRFLIPWLLLACSVVPASEVATFGFGTQASRWAAITLLLAIATTYSYLRTGRALAAKT